jgi:hypothetical protein
MSDLAMGLIDELHACGWGSRSMKPVAFLAHSLGGLVLKEALVQLVKSHESTYQVLANTIRGAVFFGVPNLGMEQQHFMSIVENSPNERLIDDLDQSSNYLRQLNENFAKGSCDSRFMIYFAYETSESPLVNIRDNNFDYVSFLKKVHRGLLRTGMRMGLVLSWSPQILQRADSNAKMIANTSLSL